MIERFALQRRARWERLSELLKRSNRIGRRLSVDELEELARLYRRTTADLAVAQRDYPQDQLTRYINQLVIRGYGAIYREAPAPFSALRRFYTSEFPREFRAAWPYVTASAAFLFVPLLVTMLAVIISRDVAGLLLPPSLIGEIKDGSTWFEVEAPMRPFMAGFIMTHNIQVAVFALSAGMLGGAGTAVVLVYNGVSIGAVAGALSAYGLADRLIGFVAPHGFLELSAVVVSAACGLMLGRALVWPGLQTRGSALAQAGVRSLRLLFGALPWLVIAGALEGFVSPAGFAWPLRLAVGATTCILLCAYLLLPGHRRQGRKNVRSATAPRSPLVASGQDNG